MPSSFLSCNGVFSFVVVVGEGGRIRHFVGDEYRPMDVRSPTTSTLRSVFVASERSAYAVGDDGVVIAWNGSRWYHVELTDPYEHLRTVAGGDDGIWIGGDNRLILHRPDSLSGMHISCTHTVKSIACLGSEAWFLTDEALIFHADDNGCRVIDHKAIEREQFNALAIGGEDGDLLVAGQAGVMIRQDGAEWEDVDTGTFDDLLCLAADGPDVWAGTHRGELRHSYDNGQTWETAAINIFGAIYSVCIVDGVVWATGAGGVVMQHRPAEGGE
jgi:photosystem II stability/assembly factor-like uncharacterized protein